ncbi:transposase [Patescibacteria group bacterium]
MKRFNLSKNVYYHVFNRGVSKMKIFKDDPDYKFFMLKISRLIVRDKMHIVRFCVMPNHFHFLLKNNHEARLISSFMKSLQLSYAKYFNCKYDHSGHVFQGNYNLVYIKSQGDFERIKKYIFNNPVKAGLVKEPKDWRYSG